MQKTSLCIETLSNRSILLRITKHLEIGTECKYEVINLGMILLVILVILSVISNSVGSRTAAAGNVGNAVVAHV